MSSNVARCLQPPSPTVKVLATTAGVLIVGACDSTSTVEDERGGGRGDVGAVGGGGGQSCY